MKPRRRFDISTCTQKYRTQTLYQASFEKKKEQRKKRRQGKNHNHLPTGTRRSTNPLPINLKGHLVILRIHLFRPHSILPRTQNPLGIQRLLDLLIQSQLRMIIPAIRLCNLIHDSQMGTIFAPASRDSVVDQCLDEPVCATSALGIFAVEDDADNVVHFTHTNRNHFPSRQ